MGFGGCGELIIIILHVCIPPSSAIGSQSCTLRGDVFLRIVRVLHGDARDVSQAAGSCAQVQLQIDQIRKVTALQRRGSKKKLPDQT